MFVLSALAATAGLVGARGEAALRPCPGAEEAPPPGGARLFEFFKDINPENVLVVLVRPGPDCQLSPATDKSSVFDMYWRMRSGTPGECRKPTHPMLKAELLRTIEIKSYSKDGARLELDISPMGRYLRDLPSNTASVALTRDGARCEASVELPLGADPFLRVLQIRATGMSMPRRSVEEVEFSGIDAAGAPARAIFRGR